jgi:hypothetical protein
MRARIQPGLLTVQAAAALNETLRRVEELDRKLTPKVNEPIYYEMFPAKITAVTTGKYSWTEQFYDSTGAYVNMPNGRTGTATASPAYERNGSTATTFPFYVQLQKRVSVDGFPTYEFDAGNGSGAGGSTIPYGTQTDSSTYSISSTAVWEDTPFEVTIPSGGTYLLFGQASWIFKMTSGEGRILIRLYQSTTPGVIEDAVTAVQSSSTDTIRGTCLMHVFYVATAACTVTLQVFRQNMLGTYDTTDIAAEESRVSYVKLA